MLDVPALLLTTLEELTEEQLKIFQSNLSIGWLLGFPPIPSRQLENADGQDTVDQMVKRYDPEGAVSNTLMILRLMNLDDLAEQLERDHTRGNITRMYINLFITITVQCRSNQKEPSTDFIITFNNTLLFIDWCTRTPSHLKIGSCIVREIRMCGCGYIHVLTEEQLKTFQSNLSRCWLPGFLPISSRQLENADGQDTVDQMVKRYDPEGAVRNTLMILRWMNLDDLAEQLERDHTRGNITRMYINLFITITVQCRSNQKEHSTDFIKTFSRPIFYLLCVSR
uniref:Pyrin domain-containing protein n=1 Tax=Hucho hucho TaxID=62062 RepID=A0A4W5LDY0_9TELE